MLDFQSGKFGTMHQGKPYKFGGFSQMTGIAFLFLGPDSQPYLRTMINVTQDKDHDQAV